MTFISHHDGSAPMKPHQNLHELLHYYGVNCHQPYYLSSGNAIFRFPQEPFRMDFYAFCLCISGMIEVEIDQVSYVVEKDGLLISAPSTVVRFVRTSPDFKMRLLFFEKNFLLKNISNPFVIEKMELFRQSSYRILLVGRQDAEQMLNLLDYLNSKATVNGKFTGEIIRTIIFNLLLETAEIINAREEPQTDASLLADNLFFNFVSLVRAEVLQHRDVAYYADRLAVSGKYLLQLTRKSSGKTPHEIIDEALLKEAYVLLGSPAINISEIAYRLQFNSVSAFGRFFKKYTSISPSEYRSQHQL